jgi:uncharacterized protein GlcG (DUF336 family)
VGQWVEVHKLINDEGLRVRKKSFCWPLTDSVFKNVDVLQCFPALRNRLIHPRFAGSFSLWFSRGINSHTEEEDMSAVTLEAARRAISAAEKKAKEIGQPMNIAVVDEGGNLVAHVRMDGAWIGSVDISQKKAYTSRAFDIATKDLATHSQSGGQFFGIHASNNGKIMIFAGGVPLKKDGKIVGAIGVSGGSGDQDHAVAQAGSTAF